MEHFYYAQFEKIKKAMAKYGNVTDLSVNEDGAWWVKTGKGYQNIEPVISEADMKSFGVLLASANEKKFNYDNPNLDTVISEDGTRINMTCYPVVNGITLSARFIKQVAFSLHDLCERKMFDETAEKFLREIVQSKKNIIIAGETGSGKTTLMNALIAEIKNERILVVEDTREIRIATGNFSRMLTNDTFTARECVKAALRKDPDRIMVGEVRGAECLDLLKAWNTGHNGGIATIHANSAHAVKQRLLSLCEESSAGSQERLIDESVDVVIQIEVAHQSRHIKEIFDCKKNRSYYGNIQSQGR